MGWNHRGNQSISSPIMLLSFFFVILLHPVASLSSLPRGSHLSVEKKSDVLVSPNNTFTCGFYRVGTNAYSFSVWFTNSADRTVVWTAQPDRPVNSRRSRVELHKDGRMTLIDADGSVVWATNTTSGSVEKAELLETGNLVVRGQTGMIIWQSFDFPTNTLLPGQPITKDVKLVSTSDHNPLYSGRHTLFYDNNNILRLMYDSPDISSIYWPNPDVSLLQNRRMNYNSSRYGVLDGMGQFVSSDKLAFKASDWGIPGVNRRLTMDTDGNLRLYSLDESTRTWDVTWKAIQEPCRVHGLCGRNGICTYTNRPKCSCPPGYEMADQSNWKKGCRQRFENISCNKTRQWKFVELQHADFFGYDISLNSSISFDSCRKICEEDCTCQAFEYKTGTGDCYPKAALFNGHITASFLGTLYIKLPRDLETTDTLQIHNLTCNSSIKSEASIASPYFTGGGGWSIKWVYGYGFVGAFGFIEFLFIATGWWFLYSRNEVNTLMDRGYEAISSHFKKFTYSELKRATGNFKDVLGRGGSGEVYKGELHDKKLIAVKRMDNVMGQGEEEFQAELSMIGRIYHMNLVRMWGFCLERSRMLLVYEFVENGSLDKILFRTGNPLGWTKRFRIALGIAKGLAYLHHECLEWIIHCDIKPENILLDANYEPKIADFGLAKLTQREGAGSNLSKIRGTKGYMAPEWTSNVPITAKVDVYSYGVILIELVKGSRLSSLASDDGEYVELRRLVRELKEMLANDDESWVEDFVDPELEGNFHIIQAKVLLRVAACCLEEERNKRPTMDSIVQTLLTCEAQPNFLEE